MLTDSEEAVKDEIDRKDRVRIGRRWRACKAADPDASAFLFIARIARTGRLPKAFGDPSLRFA